MSTLAQRSFSGGEITPSLYARTDISKYVTSLRTCRNYYVLKHGGARSRTGTQFLGEVKDSSKAVRLIPFNFSLTDNYVLEFGDLYIRFIKNGSYIYETAQNITGITQANPGVVTITGHGYSNGDEVQISGVVGMTELNGRNFKVANVTANTFELQDMDGVNFDTSGLTAYSSGGTAARIYEVTTTYVEADLFDLNYVQSGDVLTIVNVNYQAFDLSRTSDTSWSLTAKEQLLDNGDAGIPNPSLTGGAAGSNFEYRVSAVDAYGRESVKSTSVSTSTTPSSGSPITVSWASTTDAVSYRVYRKDNGGTVGGSTKLTTPSESFFGFIGEVVDGTSPSLIDEGEIPDETDSIKDNTNFTEVLNTASNAVTYFQQRFIYGGMSKTTGAGLQETVAASSIGNFTDFYRFYDPQTASNPVVFRISGRQVTTVRHLLDLNGLVIFTESSEIIAAGDPAGILTPTDINLKTQSYHGSGKLAPIVIDNTALFVQARGSIVRDFVYTEGSGGYQGTDLSIFSTHLFENYSLVDWTYDKIPNSTVWAARSDGTLLGLTYLREHQVLAWHRHDFEGGQVESVCAIPDGSEDSLYVVINRTINGATRRYVEKMSSPIIDDIVDVARMDSFLSYDGRNVTATTITISGGVTWSYDETLTLTSSASYFTSDDVGKQIHLTGSDGTIIRFTIEGYTSGTVVTGKPNKTVPTGMRSVAISDWSKAIKEVGGLWHLEGKNLSVFADGFVVASPNNDSYDLLTVSNGSVTLPEHYAVIHAGLPFTCDIETLNVDSAQGETGMDKKHIVNNVNVFVEDTRGLWVGAKPPSDDTVDPLEGLYEIKVRDSETHDQPVELKTEVLDIQIKSEWNSNGRVFMRQVDPVPATILSIMPEGNFTLR